MEANFNNLQGVNGTNFNDNTIKPKKEDMPKPPELKEVEANSSDALGSMGAAMVNMQNAGEKPEQTAGDIYEDCKAFLKDLGDKFSDYQVDIMTKFMSEDKDIANAQAQIIKEFALSDKANADAIESLVISMSDNVYYVGNKRQVRGDREQAEIKKDLAFELIKNGRFNQGDVAHIISYMNRSQHYNADILNIQKDLALELSENERYDSNHIAFILHFIAGDNSPLDVVEAKKDAVCTLAKNPKIPAVDVANILAQNFYNNDPVNARNLVQSTLLRYQ